MVVIATQRPDGDPAGMRTAIGRMPVMQSNAVKAGCRRRLSRATHFLMGRHVLADA